MCRRFSAGWRKNGLLKKMAFPFDLSIPSKCLFRFLCAYLLPSAACQTPDRTKCLCKQFLTAPLSRLQRTHYPLTGRWSLRRKWKSAGEKHLSKTLGSFMLDQKTATSIHVTQKRRYWGINEIEGWLRSTCICFANDRCNKSPCNASETMRENWNSSQLRNALECDVETGKHKRMVGENEIDERIELSRWIQCIYVILEWIGLS